MATKTTAGEQGLEESAQLARIEEAADKYSLTTIAALPRFQQALTLARGIAEIRSLLRPLMPQFMPLMNRKLGFKTDRPNKDHPAYSQDQVCDALIEATLRGLRPIGNEFNIISEGCYTTKEGFTRLLMDLPGLTDLKLRLGVPDAKAGGCVVKCSGTWKFEYKPDSIEADIPVKMNTGMGVDAALGKAERKLRARIYSQITGSVQGDGDVEDRMADSLPASKTEELLGLLKEKAANGSGHTAKPVTQTTAERIRVTACDLSVAEEAVETWVRGQGWDWLALSEEQGQQVVSWLQSQEPAPSV